MRHVYDCGTIVIASSGQNSSSLAADPHFQNATGLIIFAPATLTGTIKVQVSIDDSTYYDLQSSGADVNVAASDAVPITFQGWNYIRVTSDMAEGGARTFTIKAVEDLDD